MFAKTLSSSTKKALEKLDSSSFFNKTAAYLAGGTALALHLGHRLSIDLDFFTLKEFNEDSTSNLLKNTGHFTLNRTDRQTLIGTFETVKFSLFFYQYPLLKAPEIFLTKTPVASLQDIAAMKIGAIARRGTRRDFIDLYFLTEIFPLKKTVDFYDKKYKDLASQRTHILKSLIYFADAEDEPMPEILKPANWQNIKKFFISEVRKMTEKP